MLKFKNYCHGGTVRFGVKIEGLAVILLNGSKLVLSLCEEPGIRLDTVPSSHQGPDILALQIVTTFRLLVLLHTFIFLIFSFSTSLRHDCLEQVLPSQVDFTNFN